MSKDKARGRDIREVRDDIDALDKELLTLLGERRKRSIEAAKAKEAEADWFRDKNREEELLASRIQTGQKLGLDSHYVTSIFKDVVDDSVRIQQEYFQDKANDGPGVIRVAFQGIEGSYSHLAGQEYFSRSRFSSLWVDAVRVLKDNLPPER